MKRPADLYASLDRYLLEGLDTLSPQPRLGLYRLLRPGSYKNLTSLAANLGEFKRLKSIFVHIPKTGGTSICESLFSGNCAGHARFAQLEMLFSQQELRKFFKFCFVRNPWDRFLSAFRYLKTGGINVLDQACAKKFRLNLMCFEEFVIEFSSNRRLQQQIHLRPQWTFVCRNRLSTHSMDFVGRFESIDADFVEICNRLQLPLSVLEKLNRSEKKNPVDYRTAYSARMKDVVASFYRRDIHLFRYEF